MQARIKIVPIFFFLIFISLKSVAITYPNTILVGDTSEKAVKKASNKIANRASLYSAILPGMGQAYNKKYWKMPIIYAALGGFGVLIGIENTKVQACHKELLFRYSSPANLNSYQNDKYAYNSVGDVNQIRLDARKYLDFCIIGAGLVYLLNIIDANVDGHFRTFDMSDKLSLTIAPKASFCIQSPKPLSAGLSLTLNFK